jgi:phage-related protein
LKLAREDSQMPAADFLQFFPHAPVAETRARSLFDHGTSARIEQPTRCPNIGADAGNKVKPIVFLGGSLDDLREFPQPIRREAGYQLQRVQRGLEPDDWRPMRSIGTGVREIRVGETAGAFRVIYVAAFADAIYVLHAFQKKTRRTAKRDIDLAASRLRNLIARWK